MMKIFQTFSVFTIWLFHLSGVIGISLGFEQWFISLTPINLTLMMLLLVFNGPMNLIMLLGIISFGLIGFFIESIGVASGFPFGAYSYGENLGWKVIGVPLLIGVNWSMLVLITSEIAQQMHKKKAVVVLIAALLMVLLDFFLEMSAPPFDFWTFEGGVAPLQNYIAWFVVAISLHVLSWRLKVTANRTISIHLYLAQLFFFIYFYVYYQI